MKLYFTGPAVFEAPQPSSLLSLGGYPSSSAVPRVGLNQLFGPISQNDLRKGSRSMRAIVLKNETEATVSGAKLYYENDSQFPVSHYKMAIVTLAVDSCGKLSMEKITNSQDSPIDAIFIDSLGSANQLSLPNIVQGEYLGIWIERKVSSLQGQEQLTCEFLMNAFEAAATENKAHEIDVQIGSLASQDNYFTFDTITQKYVVWLKNVDTTPPTIANSYELLIVDVSGAATADDIALAVYNKLNSIVVPRGEIGVQINTDTVSIINVMLGIVSTSVISDPDITITITTQGQTNEVELIEDATLTITY
jgi:hypothetical protein